MDHGRSGGGDGFVGENGTRRPGANPWVVLAVLLVGFFMTLLDATIVNIAVPGIMEGLGATLDQALWVVSAYGLVYAALLITAGRLGDLFGPRNVFAWGMALFVAASAFSGLAQDPHQLIAARGLQGVGAALAGPQTLAIVAGIFPPEKRGVASGLWGIAGGLAAIAGPTLGGLIVTNLSWRWIFYVNLPVGVLVLALTFLVVPDLRPGFGRRLDLTGTVLAGLGLFAIAFGLIEGQRYAWGTVFSFVTIPGIIGLGVLLLVAFLVVQHLKQGKEPLLPFEVFKDRNYSLATLVMGAAAFATLGLFLTFPIYLQSVLGLSAMEAGLTIAPIPLASLFAAGLAAALADRFGKQVLAGGLVFFAGGLGLLNWTAGAGSARWDFLPGLILTGVGMGFTFAPVFAIAFRNVEPRLAGAASGVFNTAQELGGVVAGAAIGGLLQYRLAAALGEEAQKRADALPEGLRDRFVAGFSRAAEGGLEAGTGQGGAARSLFEDLSPQAAGQVEHLAHQVFTRGFVDAMHPTLVLPVAMLAMAALGCLFIEPGSADVRNHPSPAKSEPARRVPEECTARRPEPGKAPA